MNKRPRLELKLNQTDKIMEIIGWIVLLSIWIFTLINYIDLPEIIPTHYNGTGNANGFGKKRAILILPTISTIIFIGITILNKHPHLFNYPDTITEKNALFQYTNITRMLRVLKLSIAIIFGVIIFKTVSGTKLGTWFLPFIISSVLIPIIYFINKSSQEK